ncbi:DUF2637 domain-containing protein [Streptomyces sp. NPDC004111]|uniref:DUF2637 domain-containing protein n=1 Tax=Streptomyces sp. NPDC004111 TaxID=3364690 RepID=UPI0036B4F81B
MTTTIEPPRTAAPAVPAPASGEPQPASSFRPPASDTSPPASEAAPAGGRRIGRRTKAALIGGGIIGGVSVGGIGFVLSFDNLTAAGRTWGFGEGSAWFAAGVDISILTFLILDLVLVLFRVRFGALRTMAHVMTGATVFFNATAHGSVADHPVRALAHGLMPVLFVTAIEAGRRLLMKQTALEAGIEHDPVPLMRWVLAPYATLRMWRRMKLWQITSYTQLVELEKKRAIYNVWVQHREELEKGHEEGKIGALDRLPMVMKAFGMSVDEALALPAQMRRDEQRREQQAQAAALELTLEKEKHEASAEKERVRLQGEIASVRASARAETAVAESRARTIEAEAQLEATTALTAAERAAEAATRRAEEERAATEAADAAEARLREAEAVARTAEEEARALEWERKQTTERAAAEKQEAEAAAARQRHAEATARTAEANRRTAEETKRAADLRDQTAQITRRAIEAEDVADLSALQRRVRVVARMILAAGSPEAVDLATIEATINRSMSVASTTKSEAVELLARGYNPARGYDPDVPARQEPADHNN